MSSCPRKQLRSICTACHQGPANSSFSGRFSPPCQMLKGGEASVSSFPSTSDTSRQAEQGLITGTTFITHSRPQAPGGRLPTVGGRDSTPGVLGLNSSRRCSLLLTERPASTAGLCKLPGVGGWGDQNPAMELFSTSRVLLNAAMGRVGGNGLGWDRTSTILSPCHLFRLF